MLYIVDKLFVHHGIPYTISCGTLLGLQRHGGIIPWDDDIDILILLSDESKLKHL